MQIVEKEQGGARRRRRLRRSAWGSRSGRCGRGGLPGTLGGLAGGHGKAGDLPGLAFVENLEIALFEPAHRTAVRVAHYYVELNQLRLHHQPELGRGVRVCAEVDLVRRLRRGKQPADGRGEQRATSKDTQASHSAYHRAGFRRPLASGCDTAVPGRA